MFNVKIADITIGINNDSLKNFFNDYISFDDSEFVVEANDEDIEYEKNKSGINISDFEYLKLAIYRKICEKLPSFDAYLIHGSALYIKDSKAILLAGISGSGKSTHASLLREYYNATMINDDKPLVRIINNIPYIYGSPYDGKHHLSNNTKRVLKNVIFINKDLTNSIKSIDKNEAYNKLFTQTYRPHNKDSLKRTLELIDITNKFVDTYALNCDISKDAASLSYEVVSK